MTLKECQRVNQKSWDYAYNLASDSAKANYEKYGQKVQIVADRVDTNGGTWIYEPLQEKESTDKKIRSISSLSLPDDHNEMVSIFRDMHYCKVLSPFHALEIIYIDSQYAFGGYKTTSQLFLQ